MFMLLLPERPAIKTEPLKRGGGVRKLKLATYWFAGCSGCHMSLLDMDERILEVAKLADIVKSPLVDGKDIPGTVDITLVEGAVANLEHLEEAHRIRKHSRIVVSFGDCALTGNVPALRNAWTKEETLKHSYVDLPSNDNPKKVLPHQVISPLLDRVRPLHEVIPVDHVIPGCPPSADLIFYVLNELLNDRVPVLDKEKLKYG
jgi:NAD-reducing hydrogenase small subunit